MVKKDFDLTFYSLKIRDKIEFLFVIYNNKNFNFKVLPIKNIKNPS